MKECPVCRKLMDEIMWRDRKKYSCACGIMWWDGSTSTPATQIVFDLRKKCHKVFDKWWKDNNYSRNEGYEKLSKLMGLPRKKCHIGMFQEKECDRVLELLKEPK